MPKVRPLSPFEAKATLANRFGKVADRVRQIATVLGIRPYRVFLVWSQYSGSERGEGTSKEVKRIEILPTPQVISLDSVALSPQAAGILPMGSVRVNEISISFTMDQLKGRWFPDPNELDVPNNYEFHWEIIEDGRGDSVPEVMRFRLAADPFRRGDMVDWTVNLERTDTVEK